MPRATTKGPEGLKLVLDNINKFIFGVTLPAASLLAVVFVMLSPFLAGLMVTVRLVAAVVGLCLGQLSTARKLFASAAPSTVWGEFLSVSYDSHDGEEVKGYTEEIFNSVVERGFFPLIYDICCVVVLKVLNPFSGQSFTSAKEQPKPTSSDTSSKSMETGHTYRQVGSSMASATADSQRENTNRTGNRSSSEESFSSVDFGGQCSVDSGGLLYSSDSDDSLDRGKSHHSPVSTFLGTGNVGVDSEPQNVGATMQSSV